MAELLSGKIAAKAVLESLKQDVSELDPHLVVIQVGEDPASSSYIKQKKKSAAKINMRSTHLHLPEDISWEELKTKIEEMNSDQDITGFFVQLPLPSHLKEHEREVIDMIDPKKDVDGTSAVNVGNVLLGLETLAPATPAGIVLMLEHYNIDVAGKHVVVVGRSNTVGKPIASMLLNRHATVSVCHSKTADLSSITRQADILIAAIGRPKMITADMVRDGAVVVDVGINRTDDGLVGDTDYEALEEKVESITPVPGGVGPMTVAALMRNTVVAAKLQKN